MPPRNLVHNDVVWVGGKRIATPEYRSWQMMKNRCLNSRAGDFRYYGGRGITVCERWLKFENFLADMGRKPSPKLTLDRKNVNKNYCKSNCRWASRATQSQNRTDSKFTKKKVAEIRCRYFGGNIKQATLAKEYNTTQAAISQIVRGAAWLETGGPTHPCSLGRNRNERGQNNPNSKITDTQAQAVKRLWKQRRLAQAEIGALFGISQAQVSKIVLGHRQCAQ